MNWGQKGYESALKGRSSSREDLEYYQKECGKTHDVSPVAADFEIGYQDGLKVFCTPGYAKKFAAQGGVYYEHCPKDSHTEFQKNYTPGRVSFLETQLILLKQENDHLRSSIRNNESEISSLQNQLSSCRN